MQTESHAAELPCGLCFPQGLSTHCCWECFDSFFWSGCYLMRDFFNVPVFSHRYVVVSARAHGLTLWFGLFATRVIGQRMWKDRTDDGFQTLQTSVILTPLLWESAKLLFANMSANTQFSTKTLNSVVIPHTHLHTYVNISLYTLSQ